MREGNEVKVARVSPYVDKSVAVTEDLLGVGKTLNNQGEFQMEAIRAVAFSTDSDTTRQCRSSGLVLRSRRFYLPGCHQAEAHKGHPRKQYMYSMNL